MSETKELPSKTRKNQPGDERMPGTKDYSVILGHLINYKHQLVSETNDQKVGGLMAKISEKLQELGFRDASESVKNRLGRKKAGKYQEITLKKRNDAIEIAKNYWEKGYERNEKAKAERKSVKA